MKITRVSAHWLRPQLDHWRSGKSVFLEDCRNPKEKMLRMRMFLLRSVLPSSNCCSPLSINSNSSNSLLSATTGGFFSSSLFIPGNGNNYQGRSHFSVLSGCNNYSEEDSGEMSDDITALLSGFGRFRLNRRRLSVICDEEDNSSVGSSGGEEEVKGTKKRVTSEDLGKELRSVIDFKDTLRVSAIVVEKAVRDLCTKYNEAETEDKFRFLEDLALNFGTNNELVRRAASSYVNSSENELAKSEDKLRNSLVPDYHWLFLQIGKLDNGVKFLVDMRSDIIDLTKSDGFKNKSEDIRTMSENLRELISLWFSVGFLNVERITWDSACDMLQKVSEYEAVHPMRNWTDLKRRVGPYRRCFVFTHGSMPREPIVVLHVFLTKSISDKISTIVKSSQMMSLDSNNELEHTVEDSNICDTAIFYSITSTQKGLLGIELGNFLIKRVVKVLQGEFPKMKRFSSLSPIPGFKKWLLSNLKDQTNSKLLTEEEEDELKAVKELGEDGGSRFSVDKFIMLLESEAWVRDEKLCQKMEGVLMRLCATYLARVKRGGYAYDPVAHFHMKNGAVLWRINWLADLSPKGLNQSFGIMVNYRYFIEDCDKNSQEYVANQVLSTSESVESLLNHSSVKCVSKY